MENQSIIKVDHLDLYAGKTHILKDINIEIPKNKLTVILGPSGCGKTTLLKCMNRLTDLTPDIKVTGNIFIGKQPVFGAKTDIVALRRKMGLLSQRPFPLPMNIYNNIAYGLKLRGKYSRTELNDLVEHYLRQVNLWEEVKDRLRSPAVRLSIGQQQRLCLARGLAVNPEIILADEPTSALDPVSSEAIEKQFAALAKDYTLVMVTHVLRQARRIADYVVFMYLGEVIEMRPAREFFEDPREEQTKKYLAGAFN
ncbi:MAG: phosphate ABC transporter ATP-binding protein [Bacteroidales bacterium]|nr:phosphate ABC transporter ATP-binding protein [Bacteroidales bacterium]